GKGNRICRMKLFFHLSARVVVAVIIALTVEQFVWWMPWLSHHSLARRLHTECGKISTGMQRDQALALLLSAGEPYQQNDLGNKVVIWADFDRNCSVNLSGGTTVASA